MSSDRDTIHIVKRVTIPTQYTYEPYGTQWRYTDTDGSEICYIQVSRDEANPSWIRYGSLLEMMLYDRLEDDSFMTKVMSAYYVKE